MAKAYKYRGGIGILDKNGRSIFERDIETIVNNQLFLPTIDSLNDPTEGFYDDSKITCTLNPNVKNKYEEFKNKFQHIGIYSVSKNNDNELLWAYYASGHTGFAIEYDIDLLKKSINYNCNFRLVYDFEVEYVDSIPCIDSSIFRDNSEVGVLKKCVGKKSLLWKHEKELRLVFENTGLMDIDYRIVTGIYFGYRMAESEITYIMEKLQGRGLTYYQMNLMEKSYSFIPRPIEDKFPNAPLYIANNINYDVDDLMIKGALFEEERLQYRKYFVEALESIRTEPLIKDFYLVTIDSDTKEPLLKVFAYTKFGVPPTREFVFKLKANGSLYREI